MSIGLPLATGPAHAATPEPPSVQAYAALTTCLTVYCVAVGVVIVIAWGLLSTFVGPSGPAGAQLPATSQT